MRLIEYRTENKPVITFPPAGEEVDNIQIRQEKNSSYQLNSGEVFCYVGEVTGWFFFERRTKNWTIKEELADRLMADYQEQAQNLNLQTELKGMEEMSVKDVFTDLEKKENE